MVRRIGTLRVLTYKRTHASREIEKAVIVEGLFKTVQERSSTAGTAFTPYGRAVDMYFYD